VFREKNLQQWVKGLTEGRRESGIQMFADPAGIPTRKLPTPFHEVRTGAGQKGKISLIADAALFEAFHQSDCGLIEGKFWHQEHDGLQRRLLTRQMNAPSEWNSFLRGGWPEVNAGLKSGAKQSPDNIQTPEYEGNTNPRHSILFSLRIPRMSSQSRNYREQSGAAQTAPENHSASAGRMMSFVPRNSALQTPGSTGKPSISISTT